MKQTLLYAIRACALALCLIGAADFAYAEAELDRTPWATTMVYPVGDPLDYQQPAPGDANGFSLIRGVNLRRRGDRHEGLDLANRAQGAEVRAVAPGLVVCTRKDYGSGWGNMVVLAHRLPGGDVLFSLFAHMLPGSIRVEEGQIVALGQPLGKVGRTGHATGPHLHLEFRSLTNPLTMPLASAWEKARIVDPLKILGSMRSRDDSFGLPQGLAQSVGMATSPALAVPPDPLLLTVQAGALPRTALDRPDASLTRGELYRMAYVSLAGGKAVPARWTKLRPMVVAKGKKMKIDALADAKLPRRESDALSPASLAEMREVFRALPVQTGAKAPSRTDLEAAFPQGLAVYEAETAPYAAAPLSRATVGPPAVSRRQASLMLAYVASGGATGVVSSAESQ
jgi:hypothetical protein